ncbi:YqeG family HAD IIIA-type phosphatase [Faecalicoccus acidiformans]|uniref:YqeG family HAD IIIA-type phosphatase n=1 Tax=Faecalicoccus acidiformans TaxID=915173 RepID=A0ABS2FR87_9FIRM|nr:YqeG family HAD IIIA-type phosphatase [Faecalicoccus acidiformans]MBM6832050.1 YqeG family HAD IIIA-type phosphatase [Faecalicoccus acidiformans]
MSLFKPDYYVSSYRKIDIDRLKQAGIRLLLCDIDNTLMAYNEKVPNQKVIAFIEKVKASGITVALCSNATKKRAYRFGEDLHVSQVYYLSCKPMPFRFWKAVKDHHCQKNEVAILGDQLFTDVLGGNLAGIYVILTAPISKVDRSTTKFTRKFENFVFRRLAKKGFQKGVYDD